MARRRRAGALMAHRKRRKDKRVERGRQHFREKPSRARPIPTSCGWCSLAAPPGPSSIVLDVPEVGQRLIHRWRCVDEVRDWIAFSRWHAQQKHETRRAA